jgi:hypothetical protein
MVITRIGVWSAAKLYAAIAGTMGLIIGFIIAVVSMIGMAAGLEDSSAGGAAAVFGFGFGAVIIAPIFYGVMGLIGGAIGALLYNIFAGLVGGLEIETR